MYLLFVPWHFPLHEDTNIVGVSAKAEFEFQKQYPAVFAHLWKYKKELSDRNKAEVNIRYEWYALQRWGANYMDDFSKPKIVWAETMRIRRENTARFPRFSYAKEPFFTDKTCFMAVGQDLKYLLAFLNSKIGRYQFSQIVSMMDNGGYLMQKIYVEIIRVCKLSDKQKIQLVKLVDALLGNVNEEAKEEFEKQIDAIVFDAFEINNQEQQYLDEMLSKPLK